ncbi:MAG: 3-oxoacyl-[acyl-carrier-protein] synthase [Verrucomicrobiota bacterium]
MVYNVSHVTTKRVAVVAAGIVSPLGFGLEETLDSLRSARDCVTPVTRFPVDRCRCKSAGQIADQRLLKRPKGKGARRLHRASYMMIEAFGQAFQSDPKYRPEAAVVGTTSGGMSFGEEYYRTLHRDGSMRHAPSWIANYPPQKPVFDALDAFDLSIPCPIIANACASGTNAIGHAFRSVQSGRCSRVLTGGYDALSELVFVGFDSLQASTPEKCRPFDAARTGMVIGEGAAVLALEEWNSAQQRGADILAEIVGYGISTDNHHLTQPNPSGIGPHMAMEGAIQSANLDPGNIDYINAHGTATRFNDAAEAKAIRDLFPQRVPVSSTKAMMGHSLGAAGAIEAVFCILALQHQFLPANIHFRNSDEDTELEIVANRVRPAAIRTALSNSFGFGGTNATLILKQTRL